MAAIIDQFLCHICEAWIEIESHDEISIFPGTSEQCCLVCLAEAEYNILVMSTYLGR